MDLGIAGRRALVAGSSSGLGAAIAAGLAAEGVRVVVHGRSVESAEAVAAQIRSAGGEARVVLGDLADAEAVERIAGEALAAFEGLDILVNSAGASDHFDPWLETPLAAWERQLRISTLYAVQLIRRIAPGMQARGWGRIVNLSSAVVYQPSAFAPDYTAAKSALHSMAPGLAAALGRDGVTVNTLCSGTMMTANTEQVMISHARAIGATETGEALERRFATEVWPSQVARFGRPEEVAAGVCFLASDRAAYITGSTLRVDGGMGATVN